MRYSRVLVDHFLNPRNAGLLRHPDAVGEAEYEGCGDLARFFLRIRDGHLEEVRYQTYGCGPTIAAASVASEMIAGAPVAALGAMSPEAIERGLEGLPDDRKHAADVVAGALRAAARDYVRRHPADA